MPRIHTSKGWGNAAGITFCELPNTDGMEVDAKNEFLRPIFEKDADHLFGLITGIIPGGTADILFEKWKERRERNGGL